MDPKEKSIDFATDAVKQQITIASGVIAIFAALTKSQGISISEFRISLGFLTFSIICGTCFFLGMSDAIYRTKESETPLN